jgi:hypothetical protein
MLSGVRHPPTPSVKLIDMNTRSKLAGLCIALCAVAASANAVPILVGTWPSPSSGNAAENTASQAAIDAYNDVNNPDLPDLYDLDAPPNLLAGWIEFPKVELNDGPHTFEWTAPDTYAEYYVLSKYGNPKKKGADFDTALHYLLAGDELSYNPGGDAAPNGLSHYRIWARGETNVPDGGLTIMLLGLSLTGLAAFRRFARR